MTKIPILETPDTITPAYEAVLTDSERGIVSYRCKVLRSLLEMPWETRRKERPLVSRSGRGIVGAPSQHRDR